MVQILSVLFSLIVAIHAAPSGLEARGEQEAQAYPLAFLTTDADVSAGVLSQLSLYEQYAAGAYCENNNNSPGTKVTCPAGNCGTVEAANTVTPIEFQK